MILISFCTTFYKLGTYLPIALGFFSPPLYHTCMNMNITLTREAVF